MKAEVPWRRSSTSKRSRQSEEKGAKLSGGRRVPMSGAGRAKGDIKTVRWLIQDKTTNAVSFRLELGELDKSHVEAVREHRLMMWRITICNATYRLVREEDWLAIEEAQK